MPEPLYWIRGVGEIVPSLALNTSTIRTSQTWTATASKTISSVQLPMGARTGSASAQLRLDIFAADSVGRPTGSSLANASSTTLNNAVMTWAISLAVTLGTTYCFVLSNPDASPAANYAFFALGHGPSVRGQQVYTSPDGVAWNSPTPGSALQRVVYSDSTSVGSAFSRTLTANAAGAQLYSASGSRKALSGAEFVAPKDGILSAATFILRAVGTPPEVSCYLYQGTTLVATASNTLVGTSTTATSYAFFFPGSTQVTAGTVYQIVVGPTSATAGDASNYVTTNGGSAFGASDLTLFDRYRTVSSTASTLSGWTYDNTNAANVMLSLEGVTTATTPVYPATSDVRRGVLVNNVPGTLDVPTANQTLSGVAVDNTTGNVTLPATGQVVAPTTFGPNNALTGTSALPTASQVLSGVAVGSTTGNVTQPPTNVVLAPNQYGANGNQYTGTATGGSGSTYVFRNITSPRDPVTGQFVNVGLRDVTTGELRTPGA